MKDDVEFINSISTSIYRNYTKVELVPGKEVLVGDGSGIYFLGFNDNLIQLVSVGYSSYQTFGQGIGQVEYKASEGKFYITSSKESAISINVIRTYRPY